MKNNMLSHELFAQADKLLMQLKRQYNSLHIVIRNVGDKPNYRDVDILREKYAETEDTMNQLQEIHKAVNERIYTTAGDLEAYLDAKGDATTDNNYKT